MNNHGLETMRAALAYIPACDYELWLRMGMALKSELGENGFDLWAEWSQQDESYNDRDARDKWRSIKPNGGVNVGTLYHEAQRRGFKLNGYSRREAPPEEQIAARERKRQANAADEQQRHAQAAKKAAALWKSAEPATNEHPYLVRKGIGPVDTLREISVDQAEAILGYRPQAKGEPLVGRLLIAPVKVGGELSTVEMIDEAARKSAIANGAKAGGYWAAQPLPERDGVGLTLVIGEGVATALSAREATGHPVLAALSSGNLKPVAQQMRERYPKATLVILADLGSGQEKALEAAQAANGLVAIPDFDEYRPAGAKDFNDMHQTEGAEAVRRAVANANAPVHQQSQENALAGDSSSREWSDPLPLPDGIPPVAAFDFALLPDSLRPWAQDICERVQCAPDFVGVAIMAALGSVIGRNVGIRPQARTDWTEVPNQWALLIGRPGVLKSPAIEAVLCPLKRLAAQATEAHLTAFSEHQQAAKLAKLKAEEGEKAARAALKKDATANVAQLLACDESEEPAMRRYITNNATAEALGELLRLNPNGVLVHRDEMVSLLKSLDREDNSEARGFYLTGWNGNSGYTFDRIIRGMNLHIPAVCIALLGSTQPGRIADYLRAAVNGGAGDDGLIQRFGLLVWPDTSAEWRDVDRWPDSEARRVANRVFETLDKLDSATIGACQDKDSNGVPEDIPYLRFDDHGVALFREWRSDLETKLRAGELHPALESHLAKYRKLIPGLALILHLSNAAVGPVGKRPTLQALAWSEYLESHARRAYASVMAPEVTASKAIIYRLRRGDLARTFSSRDVWRPGWANLSREEVVDALRLLVDLDWLATTRRETGGRPRTIYEANPKGLQ